MKGRGVDGYAGVKKTEKGQRIHSVFMLSTLKDNFK